MTEIRCKKCNRLLMKSRECLGAEVKCPKCGYMNHIEIYVITEERPSKGSYESESFGPVIRHQAGEKVIVS